MDTRGCSWQLIGDIDFQAKTLVALAYSREQPPTTVTGRSNQKLLSKDGVFPWP
jgi:hypothetical protein